MKETLIKFNFNRTVLIYSTIITNCIITGTLGRGPLNINTIIIWRKLNGNVAKSIFYRIFHISAKLHCSVNEHNKGTTTGELSYL